MNKSSFSFIPILVEGIIIKRNSQFTISVLLNNVLYNAHCPTTGRIGNLDLSDRPCLLSKSNNPNRKTAYTVEAISLNQPEDQQKNWIGINQNAANRYVEHYLTNGGFSEMIKTNSKVYREQFLGTSKLDFLVGNIYLEVKTPLQHLQLDIPDYIKLKKITPFSSTERMMKHIIELGNSLNKNQRAILLLCFIYDNPGFQIIERSTNYEEVRAAVNKSTSLGVEIWQANFKLTPNAVVLKRYFKIDI